MRNMGVHLGLNEKQQQGADSVYGPLLVVAGAGSGKTKMLTARIANLIFSQGIAPGRILAVTFTNKAAAEMRERVNRILYQSNMMEPPYRPWGSLFQSVQPVIGTFHSICVRILREEQAVLTQLKPGFQILDDSDQLSIIKDCFKRLNISDKSFSPKSMQHAINRAKCDCKEPNDIIVEEFDLYGKTLKKVYTLYQEQMFSNNSVDFGEIITMVYKLFRDNSEVLKKYQKHFEFIHVDEYQDTNRAQYLIIRQLAAGHQNICVVGDEDQSIYKWRGADLNNILDFEKDYPDSKVVKLEQNYRSTKTIIEASSKLIAKNKSRKAKTLWTANEEGNLIQRFQLDDEYQEAVLVVRKIRELINAGTRLDEIAIFYRTNAQSRTFEDALRREKIPYNIVGGIKFYDRKEIKDVISYLKAVVNPDDSIGIKRIINVPSRGIGKATIDRIEQRQLESGLGFERAIYDLLEDRSLSGNVGNKVSVFINIMANLRAKVGELSLSDFYSYLLGQIGYVEDLRLEATEESLGRIENLQEFSSIIADFESNAKESGVVFESGVSALSTFLETISLSTEQSEVTAEGALAGQGMVSLMTLHASKGLEFPAVFMVGMEEGLFPSVRSDLESAEDEEEIEEERRLCYVGMTRAKKMLYMTSVVCRRVYGNLMYRDASRFFNEIPDQYLEVHNLSAQRSSARALSRDFDQDEYGTEHEPVIQRSRGFATAASPSKALGNSSESVVGKRVRHSVYGIGIVKAREGGGSPNEKLTVEFAKNNVKKFLTKFAQLEFLN